MLTDIHRHLDEMWYGRHPLVLALLPLSGPYQIVMRLRNWAYRAGLLPVHRFSAPLIVVGNITVGGTGKTPLVIWLCNYLKGMGYIPGIVSRGYGGHAEHWPQQVRPDSDPRIVGDEAVLLARRTGCPLAVGPDRVAAVEALIDVAGCDIIVSDDGLQHLRMGRDIEIAVLDSIRRFGNRHCLPAGPLREPCSRLASVDLLVSRGSAGRGEFAMQYTAAKLYRPGQSEFALELESLRDTSVHAVAGIGHPEQFFAMLKGKGLRVIPHVFPDHHEFVAGDLQFNDRQPVLMTEKDAVKCERLNLPGDCYYVPIEAQLPDSFRHRLEKLIGKK